CQYPDSSFRQAHNLYATRFRNKPLPSTLPSYNTIRACLAEAKMAGRASYLSVSKRRSGVFQGLRLCPRQYPACLGTARSAALVSAALGTQLLGGFFACVTS